MMEQRILGVLFLRKRENQPLSVEEQHMMESLANHAAVALERHRLTQAEAQSKALGEADKMKTALLSMVSHDFRSPLTAIKASVTGLLQDNLPWDKATQRELLMGINQETDRLNRMVGDILELSRLEAGAWRPQGEMVPITEVVGAALDSFSVEENRRIQVKIDPVVGEAWLDSVQIVQVLYNLLENALKYSIPTSVVELCVTQLDENLIIEVLDRGFGLPEGEEEQIFERFYRAARWRESALPGSGIGLAICRGLVEAHNGNLRAAHRDGGGSVFRLSLPVNPRKRAEYHP
jgi:two-component system sensor histidine kinase KdpD